MSSEQFPVASSSSRFPYRMTAETFLSETSPEERDILSKEIERAIIYFSSLGTTILLEGLGFLLPHEIERERKEVIGTRMVVRRETVRSTNFEKCHDLTQFHHERFPNFLETKHLARRAYPYLPSLLALKWTERDLRCLIRGFFQLMKQEIVVNGISRSLSRVGEFLSLHNRQGSRFADWFAGADIFLVPKELEPMSASSARVFDRPVFENATEVFGAAFGMPLTSLELDLSKELSNLRYDTSSIPEHHLLKSSPIRVSVFEMSKGDKADESTLIYVTDGMRKYAFDSKQSAGCEFVLLLDIKTPNGASLRDSTELIPMWPARAMTMGWILVTGTPSRSPRPGAVHAEEVSLLEHFDSDLRGVIVTECALMKDEQLSVEGPFFYRTLVGITDEEVELVKRYSGTFLLNLLEHKDLAQVSKPTRGSIVARSGFLRELTDEALTQPQPAQESNK